MHARSGGGGGGTACGQIAKGVCKVGLRTAEILRELGVGRNADGEGELEEALEHRGAQRDGRTEVGIGGDSALERRLTRRLEPDDHRVAVCERRAHAQPVELRSITRPRPRSGTVGRVWIDSVVERARREGDSDSKATPSTHLGLDVHAEPEHVGELARDVEAEPDAAVVVEVGCLFKRCEHALQVAGRDPGTRVHDINL